MTLSVELALAPTRIINFSAILNHKTYFNKAYQSYIQAILSIENLTKHNATFISGSHIIIINRVLYKFSYNTAARRLCS